MTKTQEKKAVHLIITGRVQGVFFRASTQEKAISLGLTGWVRNLASGEVEALACGPQDALQIFVDWCKQGPTGARVNGIQQEWRTIPDLEPTDFEIRYGN